MVKWFHEFRNWLCGQMSLVHPLVNGIARESGTHDHQGYETDTKWEDLPILPSRPWIYNWIEYIVSVKGPINWANILFCAHWSRYLVVTLCISSLPKNDHPSVWLLSPRKELKRKLGNTSIAPSIASACQFSNLPSQKKGEKFLKARSDHSDRAKASQSGNSPHMDTSFFRPKTAVHL